LSAARESPTMQRDGLTRRQMIQLVKALTDAQLGALIGLVRCERAFRGWRGWSYEEPHGASSLLPLARSLEQISEGLKEAAHQVEAMLREETAEQEEE